MFFFFSQLLETLSDHECYESFYTLLCSYRKNVRKIRHILFPLEQYIKLWRQDVDDNHFENTFMLVFGNCVFAPLKEKLLKEMTISLLRYKMDRKTSVAACTEIFSLLCIFCIFLFPFFLFLFSFLSLF